MQKYKDNKKINTPQSSIQLNSSELELILYLRGIKWGQVEISVQDSSPVFIKAAYQTKKLT